MSETKTSELFLRRAINLNHKAIEQFSYKPQNETSPPRPPIKPQRLEWPPAPLVTCAVFIKRTLAPWKRVLERVKEVPEHPGYDGVVEEAYTE